MYVIYEGERKLIVSMVQKYWDSTYRIGIKMAPNQYHCYDIDINVVTFDIKYHREKKLKRVLNA